MLDKYNLGVFRPRTQEGICILSQGKTRLFYSRVIYTKKLQITGGQKAYGNQVKQMPTGHTAFLLLQNLTYLGNTNMFSFYPNICI